MTEPTGRATCQECQGDGVAETIEGWERPCDACHGNGFLFTGRAIGGKARADKLTPERRSEIARKAAAARWANNACKEEKAGA